MKTRIILAQIVAPALLAGASVTCLAAQPAASDSSWYAPVTRAAAAGAFKATFAPKPAPSAAADPRVMRLKGIQLTHGQSKAPLGVQAVPKLAYFGGPMLGNVKIELVYWNKDVAYQDRLPGFYSAITKSPYFDWLKEYDAAVGAIGHGELAGSYLDDVAVPQSAQIEDADIQTELSKLIAKGSVPRPDKDTLYMVYFPPGLNIDLQGQGSCQVFCAYHSTFMDHGAMVAYGVLPDQGGSCAGGCGGDADQFNNETSVSSHEMIEAVTDPGVGLVTGNTPQAPMGWYDTTYGEIGDICNAEQGQVGAYTVQREWSNARGLCVDSVQDQGAPYTPAGN